MVDIKKLKKLVNIRKNMICPKSNMNNNKNYMYRSAEDIIKALKPLEEVTNTMLFIESAVSKEDEDYRMTVTVSLVDLDDGEEISKNAFSLLVDLSGKVMSKPQAFGAASSYAKKYALQDLLEIDDGKDDDYYAAHSDNRNLQGTGNPQVSSHASTAPAGKVTGEANPKTVLLAKLKKDKVNPDQYASFGFGKARYDDISAYEAENAIANYDSYLKMFRGGNDKGRNDKGDVPF